MTNSPSETAPSPASRERLLGYKIQGAYFWAAAGSIGRYGFGFAISLVLARLLQPSDYGLVGMVGVFTGVLIVLRDLNLGQAIVYFQHDEPALPTYCTLAVVTGVILTALAMLASPWVAAFYREPRLQPILIWLSVNLLLGSIRSVPMGVLTKRLAFRTISTAETVCSATAGLIAMAMAWSGWGVWSLVANMLLWELLLTIWVCFQIAPRFTLHPDRQVIRRVLAYGSPLTGAAMLWQFYENAPSLVIGRLLGPASLGLYTFAFRLATLVNQKISSVINRVSMPSMAVLRENPRQLAEHWLSVTRKSALINYPLLGALIMAGPDFILFAVGEKWADAAIPLRFLCMVGAVKTVVPISVQVCGVYGRTDLHFKWTVLLAIVLPPSFFLGAALDGVRGVGIAWCVVYPLLAPYILRHALRLAQVSLREYLANLRHPILTALLCVAVMAPVDLLQARPFTRLVIRAAAGGAVFLICVGPGRLRSVYGALAVRFRKLAAVLRGNARL